MFKSRKTTGQDYLNFIAMIGILIVFVFSSGIANTLEDGSRIELWSLTLFLLTIAVASIEVFIFNSIQIIIQYGRYIDMRKELAVLNRSVSNKESKDTKGITKESK